MRNHQVLPALLSWLAIVHQQTLAQDATTPSNVTFFGDGTVGVDVDAYYYTLSSALNQNVTQRICFVDSVFPPEVPSPCPDGKLSLEECEKQCADMGITDNLACPLNLGGCCECPFFSFHANNIDSGDLYSQDTSNPAWGVIPGWVNLGIWIFLLAVLVFLMATVGTLSKARKVIVRFSRALTLIGMTAFATWVLVYFIGLNGIGYQTYYAFKWTTVGIVLHVVAGSVWLLSGVVQYIGFIRRRWPVVHRVSGWICVIATLLSSLGLLILILSPHIFGVGATIISFIFAGYWNAALVLGVKYAVQRNVNAHRRWMTRHMFVSASIILQRIFNVLEDYIFETPQYFVGAFFDAACNDVFSVSSTTVTLNDGEENRVLNQAQIAFACNGVGSVHSAYRFSVQLSFCFLMVGIFGVELWLWANGLQESQQSIDHAEASISLDGKNNDNAFAGQSTISVRRQVEGEMEITLVEREEVAQDAYKLRFQLPRENEALLVPSLGHVNLRSKNLRVPRPYSPIHSLQAGYISFVVRRLPGGKLSTHMIQEMAIGDTLLLSGVDAPKLFPRLTDAKNILMLAAGTGIAPFLSLLRTTSAASCHVLVRDRSEERSLQGLWTVGGGNSSGRTIMTHELVVSSRRDYEARIAQALENDDFDTVLICGPRPFNIRIQSLVSKLAKTSKNPGALVFAVGTDDR